jgi:hypothetical protein
VDIYKAQFGRATLEFAGFSAKRMAHVLSEVEMAKDHYPSICVKSSVVAIPNYKCLYGRDGVRVEETRQTYIEPWVRKIPSLEMKMKAVDAEFCPPTALIPSDLEQYRDPVIFLGTSTSHYGHVITDMMARLWALQRVDPSTKVLFLPLESNLIERQPMRAILEALDIPSHRILTVSKPTQFEKVLCPIPAIQWGSNVYDGFVSPHAAVASAIGRGDPDLQRPVYLSRRGLGSRYRQIISEDLIELSLEKAGFLVVRPELLKFQDQVEIFRGDYPVIGVIGSALHTLLFRESRAPKPVGLLTSTGVHGRFLLADAVVGSRSTYISCMSEKVDPSSEGPVPLNNQVFEIDVQIAMTALEESGLLNFKGSRNRRADSEDPPTRRLHALKVREAPDFEEQLVVLTKDNPKITDFGDYRIGDTIYVYKEEGRIWAAIVCKTSESKMKCTVVRRSASTD